MTPARYLLLQFKKGIHRGHIYNAELNPAPAEPLVNQLDQGECCLVLVRDKRQQYCLWFTDRRLLRQDSAEVMQLFRYDAVQKVHWMAKENRFHLRKEEYFDRLEVDLDTGEAVIDGLDQAYLPVLQFLQFVAKKQASGMRPEAAS